MRWPGADCRQSIEGGFRSGGNGTRPRQPSVSRLTHVYSASDFLCLFGFAHFHKSCFEYEQRALFILRVYRGDSRLGAEDSLHCGTVDEIVLPVLLITREPQSGSELRPMPRPVQKRVRKAFAAAGLSVFRGHWKGHHLVPFLVVCLLENFSPFQ
jgi:hypothetical protein